MNARSMSFLLPVLFLPLSLLTLTACTGSTEVLAGPGPFASPTPSVPSTHLVATVADSPLPTLTPTPSLRIAEWNTYYHPSGVSLLYPANWEVKVVEQPIGYPLVAFSTQKGSDPQVSDAGVSLEVYDRLPEQRQVTDPYSWPANEGGYEVQWADPLCTRKAEGSLFVWSPDILNIGYLYAIYYSEPYHLDIRLTMQIPDAMREEVAERGWEEVISQFGFFEIMARSVTIQK